VVTYIHVRLERQNHAIDARTRVTQKDSDKDIRFITLSILHCSVIHKKKATTFHSTHQIGIIQHPNHTNPPPFTIPSFHYSSNAPPFHRGIHT
jgi:hypothetical protein